jgi:MFS family permease
LSNQNGMAGAIELDVHDELAEARVGRLHLLLGLMTGALTLFDGYDTFNPSYVIKYVMGPWGLAPSQAGLLVSSGLVGFLIGAAAHGFVADRLGRRTTLLGGMWITSLFTLATALFAHGFASFCALRLLTGLGLGVLMPLGTTYIAEFAPRRYANVFTIWGVGFGWSLGGAMAGVVGVFLTPVFGWQILYWVGTLSLPLVIALHFVLPESLRFLETQGRTEDIRRMLIRLRPERRAIYADARFHTQVVREQGGLAVLLSPTYRRTTLSFWAAAWLILFCIFGLTGWIPTVMMQRGEAFGTSFGFGALMQVMSFLGGLCCGHVADRTGANRGALAAWWGIGALSVLALAVWNVHLVNIFCVAAAGFFVLGGQFVLNNLTANAYPTRVRATAVGMMLSVGRVGAILGPFVAGVLQQVYGGPGAMFLAISAASLLAAVIIAALAATPSAARADAVWATQR